MRVEDDVLQYLVNLLFPNGLDAVINMRSKALMDKTMTRYMDEVDLGKLLGGKFTVTVQVLFDERVGHDKR